MRGEVLVLTILLLANIGSNAQIPEEEPNNNAQDAMEIYLGDTITGSLIPTDTDHFIFYLENHTNVTIIIESPADIRFTSQMHPDWGFTGHQTEGKPFSISYYLNPIDAGHRFYLNAQETTQYNLSLGIGNSVANYGNHNRSEARYVELNTKTNAILNYSGQFTEDWYNFTVQTEGMYRISANMTAIRDLVQISLYNESDLISETSPIYFEYTISTMALQLKPGNYSLKVQDSWFFQARPLPYELYVGSETDLTANGEIVIGEIATILDVQMAYTVFVSISPQNADYYNFTIDEAQTMIFSKTEPLGVDVSLSGQTMGNVEINTRSRISILPGNYSLKLSTENGYFDFWMYFSAVLPDEWDRSNLGTQLNPIIAESNQVINRLSLHSDADTDYFKTLETVSGTLRISVDDEDLDVTFSNDLGEVVVADSITTRTYIFVEHIESLLIKVESEGTGIVYSFAVYFTPDPVTTIAEPATARSLIIPFMPIQVVIVGLIIIQRFTSRGIPLYLSKD